MKLRKLFKRSIKTAPIECNLIIRLQSKKRSVVRQVNLVCSKWDKYLRHHRRIRAHLFLSNKSTSTSTELYFSPFTLECFLKFYKKQINNNVVVPHTNGSVLSDARLDLSIFYDTFGAKTNKKGQHELDSSHEVGDFKNAPVIRSRFSTVLSLLFKLIFFYNYTRSDLSTNKDPVLEYKTDLQIAKYLRKLYLFENSDIQPNLIATMPSLDQFKTQDISSVYIPAFSAKNLHNQSAYITRPATNSPKETQSNADSSEGKTSSKAKVQSSSAKPRYSKSDKKASRSKEADHNKAIASYKLTPAKSSSANVHQKTYSASRFSSEPSVSSSTSNSSASSSNKPSTPYKTNAPTKEQSSNHNLIDVSKFRNNYFPLTNKPNVVEAALGLLVNHNSNTFHHQIHFQRFTVDSNLSNPMPIQEALKSGKLDNQKYVLEIDNQWKRSANEIINGRQNVLNLSFSRLLINLIHGAYGQLNGRIAHILAQTTDDRKLISNVQNYYNVHYGKQLKMLQHDRDIQKKSVKKSLYETYLGKLHSNYAKIDKDFEMSKAKEADRIDKDSQDIFYKNRKARDNAVQQQIQHIKDESLGNLRLDIKNHVIEFKHKGESASSLLFTFLTHKLNDNHVSAMNTVSKMIQNQVELNNSKDRLEKARVLANRHHEDNASKAVVKQQKQYISDLKQQYTGLQAKLSNINATGKQTKNKLSHAITENNTLMGKLNDANEKLISANSALRNGKTSGKQNLAKYEMERQRNLNQNIQFNKERASLKAKNSKLALHSNSMIAEASQNASASASAKIQKNDARFNAKTTQYLTRINNLQSALSTNASTENSQANGDTKRLMASLELYKNKYRDLQVSNSTTMSAHNQSVNEQRLSKANVYQSEINSLKADKQQASVATTSYSNVVAQLKSMQSQSNGFQSSVASATSSENEYIASSNSRVQATIANSQVASSSSSAPSAKSYNPQQDAAEKAMLEKQEELNRKVDESRKEIAEIKKQKKGHKPNGHSLLFWLH